MALFHKHHRRLRRAHSHHHREPEGIPTKAEGALSKQEEQMRKAGNAEQQQHLSEIQGKGREVRIISETQIIDTQRAENNQQHA